MNMPQCIAFSLGQFQISLHLPPSTWQVAFTKFSLEHFLTFLLLFLLKYCPLKNQMLLTPLYHTYIYMYIDIYMYIVPCMNVCELNSARRRRNPAPKDKSSLLTRYIMKHI